MKIEDFCIICVPEVVKLPCVGCQVEGVVLGSLAKSSVSCWEKPLKNNRLISRESWTNDVTANGHVGIGGSGNVSI